MSRRALALLVGLAFPLVEQASAPTCMVAGPMSAQPERVDWTAPEDLTQSDEPMENSAIGADCLIAADEVPEGALLVDMRTRIEAELVWLDGALVEPSLHAVADRPIFRAQPLVLFGSGLDDEKLRANCVALAERTGQQVQVIRGGLRALAAGGHGVSGSLHALASSDVLDPRSLHRLLQAEVRLLDMAGLSSQEREAFGPSGVWLDRPSGNGQREVAAARADVVILPVGADATQWQMSNVPEGQLSPLLYTQGADAYRAFFIENTFKAAERVRTAPLRCAG